MDEKIKKSIMDIRKSLDEDIENLTFNHIKTAMTDEELITCADYPETLNSYIEFVKEANGLSLGEIFLYKFEELKEYQNLLNFLPDWKENWVFIGKIMSEPIGINKSDGNVYWFSEIPYSDHGIGLGTFSSFLMSYIFGKKYIELVPWYEEDEWYQFMIKAGLI